MKKHLIFQTFWYHQYESGITNMNIMIFYYFHFQTFHVSTWFNVGYLSMLGSLYIGHRLFIYDDLDTIILHIHMLLTYALPTEHMQTNLKLLCCFLYWHLLKCKRIYTYYKPIADTCIVNYIINHPYRSKTR